jgi:hypothetical protein
VSDKFEESEQFESRIASNSWETNLDETVNCIKELTSEDSDWTWAYNWTCKYICLRIDMRDGGFLILNDNGERISLDRLKWQRGKS